MNNLLIIINSSLLGGLCYTLLRSIRYNFLYGRIKILKVFINKGTILGGIFACIELYYFNYFF